MSHQFKVKRKDGKGWWTLPHMNQDQIDGLTLGNNTALHKHDQFYYTEAEIDGRIGPLEQVQIDLFEPTGFIAVDSDNPGQTLAFVNGTRTLTITPTGASFSYYIKGIKYTKTEAESLIISTDEGVHFIYYDGDTLTETVGFSFASIRDILRDNAYVAALYWDATNSKQIYFGEEYHGTVQDWKTHLYLHFTRGVQLESGGGLGDILTEESGDLDTHAQFSNQATVLWDDNLRHELTARGLTENIAVYYRTGVDASNIWRIDESASFPVLTTGTGRAAWNELTGGSWQLTEVDNLDFVLAHVFAYNDEERKYGVVVGQGEYNTTGAARDAATVEINNLILSGMPFQEMKFLGTIILQTANGYDNAVQSRIRSTAFFGGEDYIDFRSQPFVSGAGSATVVDHGALAGLLDPDHPASAIYTDTTNFNGTLSSADDTVQKALETLDDLSFTDFVRVDGTLPLTADWDIGVSRKIRADEIWSRIGTDTGLKLANRGGTGYIYIDDGSFNVGINKIPGKPLDIYSPTTNPVIRAEVGEVANCFFSFQDKDTTSDGKVYLGAIGDDLVLFGDGTSVLRVTTSGVIDVANSSIVLDEDDLNTDSATKLATQQSIKKYVDDVGVMPSGATQSGAGVSANEFWRTLNHATLPDNVVMIGVTTTTTTT